MISNRTVKAIIIYAIAVLFMFQIVEAKEEKKTFKEPLGSVKTAEVQIELGLAEVIVRPCSDDNLAILNAEYDPEHVEPFFEVERKGDKAYVQIGMDDRKEWKKRKDSDDLFDVQLSTVPEMLIKCEVGLGDNAFDLTGMKIKKLDMEAGLSETEIVLREANPVRVGKIKIESGLGEFNTDHLGYLRFDTMEFEGGLGSAKLDLRGYEGEGELYAAVGLGSIEIILPKNVGVRLMYEQNFLSDVDADGFVKVGKGRYESKDYESKKDKLHLELEIGLGDADIYWKD